MRMILSIRSIDLSWADLIIASANSGVRRAADGRQLLIIDEPRKPGSRQAGRIDRGLRKKPEVQFWRHLLRLR